MYQCCSATAEVSGAGWPTPNDERQLRRAFTPVPESCSDIHQYPITQFTTLAHKLERPYSCAAVTNCHGRFSVLLSTRMEHSKPHSLDNVCKYQANNVYAYPNAVLHISRLQQYPRHPGAGLSGESCTASIRWRIPFTPQDAFPLPVASRPERARSSRQQPPCRKVAITPVLPYPL